MAKNANNNTSTTSKDLYQMITDRIIAELENGIIPWQKPWTGTSSGAYSRATGKPYSLLNQMMLKHTGEYLTFKQALDAGGNVRKGEKGEQVVFWKFVKVREQGDNGVYEEKQVPYLRYYTVFHISQCENVEQKHQPEEVAEPFSPVFAADYIINNYATRENLTIEHVQGNDAYYAPRRDYIRMPLKEQFTEAAEYYSTLFHEAVHSTGHVSRLDRFAENEALAAFGSADYSKEELVAEIGAASMLNLIGAEVADSFRNSVAYIQSWIKVLKNDKRFIISAAGKAEKAVDYIIGEDGLNFPDEPTPEPPATPEPTPASEAPEVPAAPKASEVTFNSPSVSLKKSKKGNGYDFTSKAAAYFKSAIKRGATCVITAAPQDSAEQGHIFLTNDHIAFKMPAYLYSTLIQPIALRELPAPGESFTVTPNGRRLETKTILAIWRGAEQENTTPLNVTPYSKALEKVNARIASIEGQPMFVDEKLLECINYESMELYGQGPRNYLLAKSSEIHAIICPLNNSNATESDKYIAAQASKAE